MVCCTHGICLGKISNEVKTIIEKLNKLFDLNASRLSSDYKNVEELLIEAVKLDYKISIAKEPPPEWNVKPTEKHNKMMELQNLKRKAINEKSYEYAAILRDKERSMEQEILFDYAKTTKNYFRLEKGENKTILFYPPDERALAAIKETLKKIDNNLA